MRYPVKALTLGPRTRSKQSINVKIIAIIKQNQERVLFIQIFKK